MNTVLPPSDCAECPRLVMFRNQNQINHPAFFNGAVPSFGALDAPMLVVGLAPGLKGANATGRPFTGDYAGEILYSGLQACGFAIGDYARHADDGFTLKGVRITNAVRCVPPENKPETSEIRQCNGFLKAEIAAMPNLKVILSLGGISHKAVLQALSLKQSSFAFIHGAEHELPTVAGNKRWLLNSYHCSRYNINTGRLTQAMFNAVLVQAAERLK